MLEEPGDERVGGQAGRAHLARLGIPVSKGDDPVALDEGTLGTQGRAVDVTGKISEDRLAGTHGLAMHHPRLSPNRRRHLSKERGMILQRSAEPRAEACAEHLDTQQEVGIARSHERALLGKPDGRHDIVDVGMVNELTAPGMKGPEESEFAAQLGAGDILQRPGALAEERVQEQALVGTDEPPQFRRHGERHQVIRHRQQPRALAGDPVGGLALPALRTGAMAAAMKGKMPLSAGTGIEAAAPLRGVAGKDRRHRRMVGRQDTA